MFGLSEDEDYAQDNGIGLVEISNIFVIQDDFLDGEASFGRVYLDSISVNTHIPRQQLQPRLPSSNSYAEFTYRFWHAAL